MVLRRFTFFFTGDSKISVSVKEPGR